MTTDFSELIERLNRAATYVPNSPVSALCTEAATALQSLTSTIAGLEVDSARVDYLCMYALDDETNRLMIEIAHAHTPGQWRSLIDLAMRNTAISRARG